jgi:hypothetical protein
VSSSPQVCGTGWFSKAEPRDPSRFAYTRVFCTPDNESHFETVTVALSKTNAAPPASPLYAGGNRPVSTALFVGADAQWGTHDLQNRLNNPAPGDAVRRGTGGDLFSHYDRWRHETLQSGRCAASSQRPHQRGHAVFARGDGELGPTASPSRSKTATRCSRNATSMPTNRRALCRAVSVSGRRHRFDARVAARRRCNSYRVILAHDVKSLTL